MANKEGPVMHPPSYQEFKNVIDLEIVPYEKSKFEDNTLILVNNIRYLSKFEDNTLILVTNIRYLKTKFF